MRELLEKGREITVVPTDFNKVNRGTITEISANGFTIELKYEPDGLLRHNYCEFCTQNQHGMLYFTSYPQEINGKTVKIASPAKHRYLQRREYTRIRYYRRLRLFHETGYYRIQGVDISAGGIKFKITRAIDIDKKYKMEIPISIILKVKCKFEPIRIEKVNDDYIVSGRFIIRKSKDRMLIAHYCAEKKIELKNK